MVKVSVIIPVYNVEAYLRRCIDSVLNQTLKEIEIILVDDGSTDNSGAICDEYAAAHSNIIVKHISNSGVSAARNAGLSLAHGEYIGFVDSDDYISDSMYSELYSAAVCNEYPGMIFGDYYIAKDNDETPVTLDYPEGCIKREQILEMLLHIHDKQLLWFTCKSIYNRNILQKNNIRYIEKNVIEDPPFNLEVLFVCDMIYHVKQPLYFYYQRPGSAMQEKYKKNYWEKLENLYEAKIKIYERYSFNDYSSDLNQYTMRHTLPLLLSNELACLDGTLHQLRSNYKAIRSTPMVTEAFQNCSIGLIQSKLKWLAFLLKYKLYFPLAVLSKLK